MACPHCGGTQLAPGERSLATGTLGLMLMNPKVCMACGYAFDTKAPHIPLPERNRQMAVKINLLGGLGILAIILALALFTMLI